MPTDNPHKPDPLRWLETGAISDSILLRRCFEAPSLPSGTRLGAYQIIAELARGGMGIVYFAERADGQFVQRVAIKTVHTERSDLVQDLFKRERQLLADFKHANVARLLDGGSSADGLLWCAMELVEGDTLDVFLQRTQPSLLARLQLLLQLCDAVHAAHGRLFVHRDIKPSNVMVDADGSAKLLDFGIASWSQYLSPQTIADARSQASQVHPHAYSPKWASPEQLRQESVGPASDQHQLGQLLQLMIASEPTDRRLSGERERELQAIIVKSMQDQPEARYASVAEFSDEIKRWIDKRPVRSYSQQWTYALRAAVRRNPWQSCAFVGLFLLATGLLSFSQWRLLKQRDIARYESATTLRMNQFLQNDLLLLSDPNVSQDADLKVRVLLERASRSIAPRFTDRPEIAVELHVLLGRGLRSLDALDAAGEELALAQKLAQSALSENALGMLALEYEWAELEIAQSKFDLADQRLQRLIPRVTATLGPAAELSLQSRARALTAGFNAGRDQPKMLDALTAMQSTLDDTLGALAPLSIQTLNSRAIMLNSLERLNESEQVRLTHIARATARYGAEHSSVMTSRLNYAVILRKLERIAPAMQQAEIAQSGLEKIFGSKSLAALHAMNVRSRILYDAGQVDVAIALQHQVLSGRMQTLGAAHEQVAFSYASLGGMLNANRLADSIAAYRLALAIRQKILHPDHIDVLTNLLLLGDSLRRQGDWQSADQLLSEALERAERTLGAERQELANIRFRYAQLKLAQKQPEKARAPLMLALAVFQSKLGPKNKRTMEAQGLLKSVE